MLGKINTRPPPPIIFSSTKRRNNQIWSLLKVLRNKNSDAKRQSSGKPRLKDRGR